MPQGYRCIVVAVVGWLALAGVQQPAKQQQSQTSTNHTAKAEPTPLPYAPYAIKNADACYGAKDHDAADLCAQWRAAVAAEKAAHESRRATTWAIAATLLNLATVIGLTVTIWQTLGALGEARRGNLIAQKANVRATRQAIANAKITTDALVIAERQANIAEDTAQRQLRAYVVLMHVKSEGIIADRPFVGEAAMQNTGQTPAALVKMHAQFGIRRLPLEDDAFDLSKIGTGDRSECTLAPNQPMHTRVAFEKPFSSETIERLAKGESQIYCFGVIEYEDVFGQPWTTKFRQILNPDMKTFSSCPEGNEFT